MTKKLTLTVEERIIEHAKKYAYQNGLSLSELVEDYLRLVTTKSRSPESRDYAPKVKKLLGSVKLPKEFDYKKELSKSLMRKYSN